MRKKNVKKCKKLLPRHKIFVCALAAGKDRVEAYVEAYPRSVTSNRDRISRSAYNLLQRPEVLAAYEAELEKHREEEKALNRWTYEKSVEVRMNTIKAIEEERERRRVAQETMAKAMMEHPPEGMSPEDAMIEVQRILMMPILTTQTTNAVAALCDGLDKLTGLTKDTQANAPVIVLGMNDVDE